eukprot:TRINITY_DN1350_c2_g1_i2.p1 TRINITY_DN1350_c2_g1~~TRINITY_DN1350_c2_g1_i2.p1  ORF type:complete len:477 (+),score=95.07 TRINITY_DN1350_c2_g1_i2:145-1575(+)
MFRCTTILSKDLYKILGVTKNASSADIKKAYKQKAAQLHPDVNSSPNAAKDFSELNDAYETLKDQGKREYYHFTGSKPNSEQDVRGYEDLKRAKEMEQEAAKEAQRQWREHYNTYNNEDFNHGYDLNDKRWRRYEHNPWGEPFIDPFYATEYADDMNFRRFSDGGRGGHWKRGKTKVTPHKDKHKKKPTRKAGKPQKGADIHTDLQLSLEDIMQGCSKSVTYKKTKECWECNGTGYNSREKHQTCGTCEGAGVYLLQHSPSQVYEVSCEDCGGQGFFARKCRKCKGETTVSVETSVTTGLPPGLSTGCTVRIVGEGNAGVEGGAAGDLLLNVKSGNNHQKIVRGTDNSLLIPVIIPWTTSVFGGNVKVTTHCNEEIEIVIKPNTPHLSRIILPCEGLDTYPPNYEVKITPGKTSNLQRPSTTGKVYGYVVVLPPDLSKLTPEEQKVLSKLCGCDQGAAKAVEQDAAGFIKAKFGAK